MRIHLLSRNRILAALLYISVAGKTVEPVCTVYSDLSECHVYIHRCKLRGDKD